MYIYREKEGKREREREREIYINRYMGSCILVTAYIT